MHIKSTVGGAGSDWGGINGRDSMSSNCTNIGEIESAAFTYCVFCEVLEFLNMS